MRIYVVSNDGDKALVLTSPKDEPKAIDRPAGMSKQEFLEQFPEKQEVKGSRIEGGK